MVRVTISQAKAQLSRYLRSVERGEEVVILDRDRPVARLVGVRADAQVPGGPGLLQMEKDGLVRRGSGKRVEALLTRPPGKGAGVLEALLSEREDR